MRTSCLLAASLVLAGCAHDAPLPGSFAEHAVISSGSACHTFDVSGERTLRYTCFVHADQNDGSDVSTPESRAKLISSKLAAVCNTVTVADDELFRIDDNGKSVWRAHVRCNDA